MALDKFTTKECAVMDAADVPRDERTHAQQQIIDEFWTESPVSGCHPNYDGRDQLPMSVEQMEAVERDAIRSSGPVAERESLMKRAHDVPATMTTVKGSYSLDPRAQIIEDRMVAEGYTTSAAREDLDQRPITPEEAAERLADHWARLMPDVSIGTPSKPDGHVHRGASDECVLQLVREELACLDAEGLRGITASLDGDDVWIGLDGLPRGGSYSVARARRSYQELRSRVRAWTRPIAAMMVCHRPCGVCHGALPLTCPSCNEEPRAGLRGDWPR